MGHFFSVFSREHGTSTSAAVVVSDVLTGPGASGITKWTYEDGKRLVTVFRDYLEQHLNVDLRTLQIKSVVSTPLVP